MNWRIKFLLIQNFTSINRLICNKGRIFPFNTFLLTVNLKWQSTLTVFEFKLNSFLLVIVLFKSHIMTGIICCFLSISYKLIFKQVKEYVFSGTYSLEEMFFCLNLLLLLLFLSEVSLYKQSTSNRICASKLTFCILTDNRKVLACYTQRIFTDFYICIQKRIM